METIKPVSSFSTHSLPCVAMADDATTPHDAAATQRPTASPPTTNKSEVPKPKRLACMICRKRKLKCDGHKPSCSTCTRLGHDCAYDEVRRKSGPKRGYVKALEERLKQVETLLKTQDPILATGTSSSRCIPTISPSGGGGDDDVASATHAADQGPDAAVSARAADININDPSISIAKSRDMHRWQYTPESPPQLGSMDEFNFNSRMVMDLGDVGSTNFTWEMIGLGLEEPLPPQETIDELHEIYFEKIHPSMPMIHKLRYLAAMNLAPNSRPPVCLRYAIWTLACSVTDKYDGLKELFYQRARKYIEADYVKGFGVNIICVAHTQTHILLTSYELKMMCFPRAWMSAGAAVRLAQMIGLYRLDGAILAVKQCLPPARDWTEQEERRRTFWMAFAYDRYSSIGTGWPMVIDERDIKTSLPSSEEAFEMSRPEQVMTLTEALSPAGAAKLNSFSAAVLMSSLFGQNLNHLHRPDEEDNDHDLNGKFWKRHRKLDNILLNTSLCLPPQLKLPEGLQSPSVVYTNMCIHTSTICLHQAAIFKADKNRLPGAVGAESKVRCITAANEIASIMRMVSHMDLSAMNPFLSFCLYVSSRVFVQYLKSRPEDSQSADSLRFLLAAMNAFKRKNPLTESFLIQLDVDLEALATRIPMLKGQFPRSSDNPTSETQGFYAVRNASGLKSDVGKNGIPAYRDDCFAFKGGPDDTGPVEGPDLFEPESNHDRMWISSEDIHILQHPRRAQDSGGSASNTRGHVPGIRVTPISPRLYNTSNGSSMSFGQSDEFENSPNPASSQQTPNSGSTPSDRPQQRTESFGTATAAVGRDSYDASPTMANQAPAAGYYGTSPQFGSALATGIPMAGSGGTQNEFVLPAGWGMSATTGQQQEQQQQQQQQRQQEQQQPQQQQSAGMPIISDRVLRNLVQMAPMETMDFGWDSKA